MTRCGAARDVDGVLHGISACSTAAKNIASQRAALEGGSIVLCLARAVGLAAVDGSRCAVADFDGVVLGVAALRMAAIDVQRRGAAREMDGVARCLACALGIAAIDLFYRAARELDDVARSVAVPRFAAVGVAVERAARNGDLVFLRLACVSGCTASGLAVHPAVTDVDEVARGIALHAFAASQMTVHLAGFQNCTVARSVAAIHACRAAFHVLNLRSRALKRDPVVLAVVLFTFSCYGCGDFCRPAAVGIAAIIAVQRDIVARRRIAREGASAPHVRAVGVRHS